MWHECFVWLYQIFEISVFLLEIFSLNNILILEFFRQTTVLLFLKKIVYFFKGYLELCVVQHTSASKEQQEDNERNTNDDGVNDAHHEYRIKPRHEPQVSSQLIISQ